jgi:hypothetical protein
VIHLNACSRKKVELPQRRQPRVLGCLLQVAGTSAGVSAQNYRLWQANAFHPSLNFKKVGGENWSVRIGDHYRAMGKFVEGAFLWEWIGPHEEYNRLV